MEDILCWIIVKNHWKIRLMMGKMRDETTWRGWCWLLVDVRGLFTINKKFSYIFSCLFWFCILKKKRSEEKRNSWNFIDHCESSRTTKSQDHRTRQESEEHQKTDVSVVHSPHSHTRYLEILENKGENLNFKRNRMPKQKQFGSVWNYSLTRLLAKETKKKLSFTWNGWNLSSWDNF